MMTMLFFYPTLYMTRNFLFYRFITRMFQIINHAESNIGPKRDTSNPSS